MPSPESTTTPPSDLLEPPAADGMDVAERYNNGFYDLCLRLGRRSCESEILIVYVPEERAVAVAHQAAGQLTFSSRDGYTSLLADDNGVVWVSEVRGDGYQRFDRATVDDIEDAFGRRLGGASGDRLLAAAEPHNLHWGPGSPLLPPEMS